ncbi:MAG: MBL fold metallo-hydrolase, partial [Anaerolineales bacterium]
PEKHERHGLKVLIKFKLLEWQSIQLDEFLRWGFNTEYLRAAMPFEGKNRAAGIAWLQTLLNELFLSKALVLDGNVVRNA